MSGAPLNSTPDLRKAADSLTEDFILINTKPFPYELGYLALERFAEVAEYTGADMLYSDHYEIVPGPDGKDERRRHPAIECQPGALRDDFDFGPLVVFRSSSFLKAVAELDENDVYGAIYDLRLRMDKKSTSGSIFIHQSRPTSESQARNSSTMSILRTARCRSKWKESVQTISNVSAHISPGLQESRT